MASSSTAREPRCRPVLGIGCLAILLAQVAAVAREPSRTPTPAADPQAEAVRFFEARVRPVLLARCAGCHGPEKHKAGLRVDSLAALLAGGDSGPAVVPGDPASSNLVAAIRHDGWEMPPDGRLPAAQVEAIEHWIAGGAVWPGGSATDAVAPRGPAAKIGPEDRSWWSYQPVQRPEVPAALPGDSPHPIDRFIRHRLAAEGLGPAEPAEPAVLVRRLFLDLTGMPPTGAEANEFLAAAASHPPVGAVANHASAEPVDAYALLVDRLLVDPRFGERLARQWLDLVRYADSDGFRQDAFRAEAWRYRDWVIDAFNADMPYDRFVALQLAGDELAPDDPGALVATGFLRHGPYEYNQVDVRSQWTSIVDEATDVTADVFLALGMSCAKCHDHKFDPLLQTDYYRLRAFLAPITWRDDEPLAGPADRAEHERLEARWREAAGPALSRLEALLDPTAEVRPGKLLGRFPADIQDLFRRSSAQRSPEEEQLVALASRQVRPDAVGKALAGDRKQEYEALVKTLAEIEPARPKPLPVGAVIRDVGSEPPPTRIPGGRRREPLEPGFPEVLGGGDARPTAIPAVAGAPGSTGRRTALAAWITSPANPLTARVLVNRLWQRHFGRGLAANPSDFGRLGEPPSHPELLDWLAAELVSGGWSIRHVERLILTSHTYRQSSRPLAAGSAPQIDPLNTLLWRGPRRRLDAEQVRDSALLIAGSLDPARHGPGVPPTAPRRGIYTRQMRNTRDPLFDAFDGADAYLSTPVRNVTTTPTQALFLVNGDWMLARAEELAARIDSQTAPDASGSPTRPDAESRAAAAAAAVWGPGVDPRVVGRLAEFLSARGLGGATDPSRGGGWLAAPMPQRAGQAAVIDPGRIGPALETQPPGPSSSMASRGPSAGLPQGELTIEASVMLQSLFPDATVRTIAASWSGSRAAAGWSLGVTSEKSAYRPRNLILQLCDGSGGYEVVASDIHLDLDVPYSVSASLRLAPAGGGHVTFVVRDLSDNDAETIVRQVGHRFAGGHSGPARFTIGGRHLPGGPGDARAESCWDGLIDDVRLTARSLERGELWMDGSESGPGLVGEWRFEEAGGFAHDSSGNGLALVVRSAGTPSAAAREPLVDLCHVLFNSSGFLHVD